MQVDRYWIRTFGWGAILFASACFFLGVANLRSRRYFHGPDYSLLFWIAGYLLLTGIGLLKARKWAVLLCFAPAAFCAIIMTWRCIRHAMMPASSTLFSELAFVACLAVLPLVLLRGWKELHW